MIHLQNQKVRYQIPPAHGIHNTSVCQHKLLNNLFNVCMNSSDSTEYEISSNEELFDDEELVDNDSDDFNGPNDDEMDINTEM